MAISTTTVNKLILARHLFWMARDNLKSGREVALFATVNLLQDAVEAFLLAASEFVNANIDSTTTFERYFVKIEESIAPTKLPFRAKLVALNKVRIAAKHHGVKPDRTEVDSFVVVCREFFDESCLMLFGVPFWSISLVDLLDEGETKQLLQNAQMAFNNSSWIDCMIECRKIIFLQFEKDYDIESNRHPERGFFERVTSAPDFAKRPEYFETSVCTPFDYVVIDHNRLEAALMSEGIDTQIFWNIWRLTPEVYRFRKDSKFVGEWLVKRDLRKESDANEENAAYVLEQTIDICVHLAQRRRLSRGGSYERNSYIELKREGVNIYEKADHNGPVRMVTKPGSKVILADYGTVGLNGQGTYWYVIDWEKASTEGGAATFYYGYIYSDDVAAGPDAAGSLRE